MMSDQSDMGFKAYTFLFGDKNEERIDYKEYANNRTYWDRDFYNDENWNPSERDWDFLIHVKKEM